MPTPDKLRELLRDLHNRRAEEIAARFQLNQQERDW